MREYITKHKHLLKKHPSQIYCEVCEISEPEKSKQVDANMPSTSLCVSCTYESEFDNHLKTHMRSKHKKSCDSFILEADNSSLKTL